ncbi:MAG: hypothetical protein HRT58_12715 [Crocinitomicaceae bacterium]|nr:hypothetical protein [Flavobacteriales bacterium]NQZ36526.1 hypothetical protein [Crocinitomicaceae bacterium]
MKISKKSAWTNLSKSLVKNAQLSILSAVVMLFLALSAHGQKLEDFKKCADKPGISTLPYQKIKRDAIPLESAKKRAFEATKGYGYDKMEDEKDAILRKIKVEKKKIIDAKKEVAEDKKAAPTLESPGEKKIKAADKKISELDREVVAMNRKIDVAIDKFETLQEARGKVREIFEDADGELTNTINRPHVHIGPKPSSSDREAYDKWNKKYKQLKSYVDKIGDVFDKKARTHREQENGARNVVTKLNTLKRKTEI